ncbi:1-acyl-sn-glycerol-3-phosphate acyltransferase [Azoarcus sp. TTM-91]|nr:1-acyl-sn-glycerol-3-phosphate acyltransferase [Azoarcus sp. TTM-91]
MRGWRSLCLGLHILQGALTIALRYRFCTERQQDRLRQRWSRRLLKILGIKLSHDGLPQPGALLVANHVSWLDIYVINAVAPSAFVSKAEVRGWPLIGWLAARNSTIFLRRGSRGHARIVNQEIDHVLGMGRNVAVFPEGTTTDGSQVLHFHAALLQPAVSAGRPVQALAISYLDGEGRRTAAPAYDGDLSLGACLANILAHRRLTAHLCAAAPMETATRNRRDLAETARADIIRMAALNDPLATASAAAAEAPEASAAAQP